jgi:acyl dehydratase
MAVPARLDKYTKTTKQRHFSRDFLAGWENYETWEEATVGDTGPAQRTFEIAQEDIIAYNRACGETDPLMIDPVHAKKHSPTGSVLPHPVFVTTIGFYSLGEKGLGTWARTPGARNPQQRIEINEPLEVGEIITTTVTTTDKFIQRDKAYLQMLLELHNEKGVLKARWWATLILPRTRADVAEFANA